MTGRKVLKKFNDLETINPVLASQWHPTKNEDLTPQDVTPGSGKKVWWICRENHIWQASVSDRSSGYGCPFCSGQKVLLGYNDLGTKRPDLVKEWHKIKNAALTPYDVTTASGKKVWWQCSQGHEWQAVIGNRLKGVGCPFCSGRRAIVGVNDLATIKPDLVKQWHSDKNGQSTPQEFLVQSNKKVWWECEKGHEWQAVIGNRSKGVGCPYCAGTKVWSGFNDLASTHPGLAKEWHPTNNTKLSLEEVSFGTNKKAWWKCEKGHEWQALISSRSRGVGCPYCAGQKIWIGFNDLASIHPELVKEWDQIKNKDHTPKTVTAGSSKKVWWICKKAHEWQATIASRSGGSGCPHCFAERKTSYPEQAVYYYLRQLVEAQNRYKYKKHEIDIYLTEFRIGIEYDGRFHERDEIQKRDYEKDLFLKSEDITLIRIKGILKQAYHVDNEKYIIYHDAKSMEDLQKAIIQAVRFVEELTDKQFLIDINLNRDSTVIYEQYIEMEKAKSLSTMYPHLLTEWSTDRNGKLNPSDFSYSSQKAVWWTCNLGHEWRSKISNRTQLARGCPYCAGQKVLRGYNDLATVRPNLAMQWHPNKNGKLTPYDVTARSGRVVWWKCENDHEWDVAVSIRKNCPYCAGRKVLKGYNDLDTVNPELARQWHLSKNDNLLPSEFTLHSNKRIWWQCEYGHEWQTTINNRARGYGCPYCSGRKVIAGINDLSAVNQTLAEEWHPIKNGDLLPSMFSEGSGKTVWWLCEKGHEWQAPVYKRTKGSGCPSCLYNRKR